MPGVTHQSVPVQIFRKKVFAGSNGIFLAHLVKAQTLPTLFGALNDESASLTVKAVGMRPNPAVYGFFKNEGEGFENLVCTKPDKTVGSDVDIRLEVFCMLIPDPAVDSITSDNQVCILELIQVMDFMFEMKFDSQFKRPFLEQM
mgnify:CR=1 FL=1